MNTPNPFATIIAASRKHPWLLVILLLALAAHGADLQWPALHIFFSTIDRGFFAVALIFASGTSLANPNPPPNGGTNPPTP